MTTFENAQNRLKTRIRRKSKFGMTMLLSRIRMIVVEADEVGGAGRARPEVLQPKSVNDIQTWNTSG